MKLAICADSSWNRWHPTYEEIGKRCIQLGIGAVELVYYPQNQGFDHAAHTLARHGAKIVCVNATAKWRVMITDDVTAAQRAICDVIRLAKDVGAEFVITYPGHNPAWSFDEIVEQYKRRMEPCHDLAAELGITMLLENHFDLRNEDPERTDVVREPELTARFIDALDAPQVRVNFDAGNVYAAGIEPWPYGYRILRDYIAYAHLKGMARFSEDLYGPADQYETLTDVHTGTFLPVAVGDCGINYRGMLMEMARDETVKYVALEDHAREEHAEQVFERGATFAREAILSAGVRRLSRPPPFSEPWPSGRAIGTEG